MAPEIEAGVDHYTAADIWALGQISYQLLCCNGEVKYLVNESGETWGTHIDPTIKELIVSMTQTFPDKRPNINEVLEHSWFAAVDAEEEKKVE